MKKLAFLFSFALLAAGVDAQVVFNEIHYNPVERPVFDANGNSVFEGTTTPADLSDDIHEFLELRNPSASSVDLSGWRIEGGVEFTFPSGTSIPAGGFVVVAKNPARIQTVYGISGVLGPFANGSKLSNKGDTFRLVTPANAVVDSVTYGTNFPWAISANKLGASDDFTQLNSANYQYKGRSLQRVSAEALSNDPANWVAVRPAGAGSTFADLPTPGAENIVSRAIPKPVVTAISATQLTDGATIIRSSSQVRIAATFSSAASLSNVQVEYFVDNINAFGEPRTPVTMTSLGNNQFTATLPAQANRSIVRYRIVADRGDGVEVVSPRADDPAVVPVSLTGREPWYAYFITPTRSSAKQVYDCFVSSNGTALSDTLGANNTPFTGLNGLQAMAYHATGNLRRINSSSAVTTANPRDLPYVPATDRLWNGTVPAVFVVNGVVRDIQLRFHGSRYNRVPSRKSYKMLFLDYQKYQGADSIFITDKSDFFNTAHGLHQLAGLPITSVRYVDWYLNNDGLQFRLEQGEYNGDSLDQYHEKMQRLNPGSKKEATGEFYKSAGIIVGTNAEGEGPYGSGNGWRLPPVAGPNGTQWSELKRFEFTYGLQNNAWKGSKPIRDMINGMWTARGDNITSTGVTTSNPNLTNLKAWLLQNWDVDTELTSMALGNWMCPWDDTTQNHFYWRRANGKWVRLLWDFDNMYGRGDGTSATSPIYLGEVGSPGNNSRGPNFFKDSFLKAFRTEYKQRLWFLNNTLLDPENLQTLTYQNSSGATVNYRTFIDNGTSFSSARFSSVNSQVALGTFYKPTRPSNTAPSNNAAVLPGANLTGATYNYNAALTHAAAPTVSPHTKSKWEIRTATGTYDDPVYILTSTTDLTSLPIPFGQLTFGQKYFWRVTYYDADGHPSITSNETAFFYGQSTSTAGNVTINEVMADNRTAVSLGADHPDYVELKNNSAADIDISGWNLTDDELVPGRFIFPAGTTITAGGYLVVWCDENTTASGLHSGFALSRKGQRVLLIQNGTVQDGIAFGPQAPDSSIGRFADGTGTWTLVDASPGATNSARPFSTATDTLKVNEWMAVPATGSDWFEIYNSGSQPVALAGLWLSDTPGTPKITQIPALSFIASGGCVRFDADGTTAGFSSANFKLSTGGDNLILTATDGITTVDSVSFGAQQIAVSQGRFPDGTANIASFPVSSSPGDNNWLPAQVRINEALSSSVAPLEDYVEIYNPTASDVDISNWWLSDDHFARQKYQFPAGSIVRAGGYFVVTESQFNTGPNAFALSSLGDEVVLTAAEASGVPTGYRTQFNFGAAADNVPFGYVSTAGAPEFWPQVSRTPGKANSRPKVGPVIINEIHYHPPNLAGGDNVRDEFIELYNLSSTPVNIGGWKLKGGSDFTFAPDTIVAPGEYILVVGFDPATDLTSLEGFRTALAVPQNVLIYGPFTPKLGNDTGSVELAYPLTNDVTGTRFINVDKIEYADFAPWPISPDGNGPSLQRIGRNIGNDAANWSGQAPTAGVANSGQSTSNAVPQAVDDTMHALPLPANGGGIPLDVTANDTDADGDELTVVSVTQGANGTVEISGPGTVTYTPGATYTGNDSFTYTVSDGFGATSTATVTFTNAAPVAAGETFHPAAGLGPQTFAVLGNNSDADSGDTLTIAGVTNGAHGAVTTDGTSVTYAPGVDYNGNDSFTYAVSDGRGGTATATVALTNALPVAGADSAGTTRGLVTINVVANDTDGDGDGLIVSATSTPKFGSVAVSGGSITYTPTGAFKSGDSFSYTVTDGRGGTSSASVTIFLSDLVTEEGVVNGEQVPGEPVGTVFTSFGAPSINSAGETAFLGTMKSTSRQVKTGIFAGVPLAAVATKGSVAPGVTGGTFSVLKDPVLNEAGNITFIASIAGVPKNSDTGIWFKGSGDLELLAREGMPAPDSAGATFSSFLSLGLPDTGRVVFTATLTKGGGVTPKNDLGVWAAKTEGGLRLVVREGDTVDLNGTDHTVKSVAVFGALSGSPGQRRGFNGAGDVLLRLGFTDGTDAVVRAKEDGTFEAVAIDGGSIPALASAQFDTFGLGALGKDGGTAIRATLKKVKGVVSATNNVAVVSGTDGSDLQLVARTGGDVPGVSGAVFKSLQDPVSDADGNIAFVGTMRAGSAGVTTKNDTGVWVSRSGASTMLVREGAEAPEIAGANFAAFTSVAFPSNRGVAFVATLAPKTGGVTKANDVGLWAQDRTGALRLLVREGQSLDVNGAQKTLKSFAVLGAVPTSPSQGHSYSENGGIVYRATFIDGSQGIFTVWVP